jgi:hypothetical protein
LLIVREWNQKVKVREENPDGHSQRTCGEQNPSAKCVSWITCGDYFDRT